MPDEMTDLSSQRLSRLYENYTTTHAGRSNFVSEARLIHRDVIPHLAVDDRDQQAIVDLGCGQGALVDTLARAGYSRAVGIDISPQQVASARASGVDAVKEGDYRNYLPTQRWNAITAVDFVEHLDQDEVLELFDVVRASMEPGGRFIARMPNNGSPFSGRYQYGDFTHKTAMTPRSFTQVANAAGFERVVTYSCEPVAHDLKSTVQVGAWKVIEAGMRMTLAAEAGARKQIVTQNFYGMATVAQ